MTVFIIENLEDEFNAIRDTLEKENFKVYPLDFKKFNSKLQKFCESKLEEKKTIARSLLREINSTKPDIIILDYALRNNRNNDVICFSDLCKLVIKPSFEKFNFTPLLFTNHHSSGKISTCIDIPDDDRFERNSYGELGYESVNQELLERIIKIREKLSHTN